MSLSSTTSASELPSLRGQKIKGLEDYYVETQEDFKVYILRDLTHPQVTSASNLMCLSQRYNVCIG
jgi:hypothetical protein